MNPHSGQTKDKQMRVKEGSPDAGAFKRRTQSNLIVVTGPSGVGKGTVVSKVLDQVANLVKSVSVTTRSRRPGEDEGVDYFFRSPVEFEQMIDSQQFMEWAEFAGNLYGTPESWVLEQLNKSKDVILEIEVHGAKQIMERFPQAVFIFLSPPSLEALRQRLKGRGTESAEMVVLRLTKARQEMREKGLFHYEVVNDNIDDAVNNLKHIVYAERCRIRETRGNEPFV
jgi:guanylate kinase